MGGQGRRGRGVTREQRPNGRSGAGASLGEMALGRGTQGETQGPSSREGFRNSWLQSGEGGGGGHKSCDLKLSRHFRCQVVWGASDGFEPE